MPSERHILGIDIGTAGCKCIVVDLADGTCVGQETSSYPILAPHASWVEQDPDAVLAGVIEAVRRAVIASRVSPKTIWALSFGGALHSVLAVDREGLPLTKALIWADTRSRACSLRIRERYDAHQIYHRTGCPVHPLYPASKIVWIRENNPGVYRTAHKFVSLKEYVLHKLVNRYLVDRSVASGTGLFNLNHLDWDDEMLRIVGATADRLSEHVATTTVVEGVEPRYAREMGVRPDSLVVIGAGDGLLSNLGAGSVEPGQATCTVGTSGAFRVLSREPKLDEKERTWCYLLTDEAWVVGGAINNAGLAYRWIRELLYHDEDAHAALDEEAGLAGAGSEGLVFLPYLSGERSPSWNPVARGVLFGLALHHNRRHLLRAVVEGVAYAMYAVLLAVEDVTGQTTEIRGSGGLLRSPLWVQVMADVCGREIVVPHVVETTALGAVLLAMYALGEITDLVQARERVPIGACYAPHAENHELYLRLFGIYERLYEGVASQFAEICEIQGISGACEGSSGSDPSLASV